MRVDGTLQIFHVYLFRCKEQHPRLDKIRGLGTLTPQSFDICGFFGIFICSISIDSLLDS